MSEDITKKNAVVQINEAELKDHLGQVVLTTVEDTLNAMLDAEADELVGAGKYERNAQRQDYRSGHYKRKLHTKAGEVELKVPTSCVNRRLRRRSSNVIDDVRLPLKKRWLRCIWRVSRYVELRM